MTPTAPLPEKWEIVEKILLLIKESIDIPKRDKQTSSFIMQTIRPTLKSNLFPIIQSYLHQSYEQGKREMGEKTIKWMTKQGYEGLQKEYKNSLTNERKEEE